MAFQEKLENYLTVGLPTYRDEDLRDTPGVSYPPELALNLCRSICMIAILMPQYMESSWCRAEWQGMVELEEKRKTGSTGSIIPVLYRGDPKRTQEFVGKRVIVDFSHVDKPKTDFNTKNSRRTMERIAQQVANLASLYSPSDCGAFILEVGEDVADPRLDDPSPLV